MFSHEAWKNAEADKIMALRIRTEKGIWYAAKFLEEQGFAFEEAVSILLGKEI